MFDIWYSEELHICFWFGTYKDYSDKLELATTDLFIFCLILLVIIWFIFPLVHAYFLAYTIPLYSGSFHPAFISYFHLSTH